MFRRLLPLMVLMAAALPAQAQPNAEWDEPFPPHRIADNLYYVGSKGLSTYLITTRQGHILINSSFERTVPLIRKSVEQLGFKIRDVKILLISHAHGDHAEGMGLLKELTGARVFVMQGDDKTIASGAKSPTRPDGGWRACPVDRVLKDGDRVTLGEATLTARLTPGHTPGCTTWTMQARDGDARREIVVIGSPNVNPGYQLVNNAAYPQIATDYAKGFAVLKSLPCDIFLGAHGNYYGMVEKAAKLAPGAKNPFVDPEGYRAYITEREKAFLDKLEEQKKAAKAPAPAAQSSSAPPKQP